MKLMYALDCKVKDVLEDLKKKFPTFQRTRGITFSDEVAIIEI